MICEQLEPKEVFRYFEEISAIPRGSGNTGRMKDYLVDFAESNSLEYFTDKGNNIIIKRPGTIGRERDLPIALQGHYDMVSVKMQDCNKDMDKDPLNLALDGDYLYARQTSLGGDDGIGVAYMMALLTAKEISLPPLECIFTDNEEIGMLGAGLLNTDVIKSRSLINLDNEEEGHMIIGCAGGVRFVSEFEYIPEKKAGMFAEIILGGGEGGHSGMEINKGRINAVHAMGRVIGSLRKEYNNSFRIAAIDGGTADNVIPGKCRMEIMLPEEGFDHDKITHVIKSVETELKTEYSLTDAGIYLSIGEIKHKEYEVWPADIQEKIAFYLNLVPDGIQNMSHLTEGVVETSLNLGMATACNNKLYSGTL